MSCEPAPALCLPSWPPPPVSEGAPTQNSSGDTPLWELREMGSRQLHSRFQGKEGRASVLTWHTVSLLPQPPPTVATSTLPGILSCCHGLAWGSGDLGHVPALLVICYMTLGKSCPHPHCCFIYKANGLDLMTSTQVTPLGVTCYFHFPHLSLNLPHFLKITHFQKIIFLF